MFFILAKLLDCATQPIVWIAILLLLGVIRAQRKHSFRLLWVGLAFAYLLSNEAISSLAMRAWEIPATPIYQLKGYYDVAIVLGGFTLINQHPDDRVYINQAADRLLQTIQLYKLGKISNILVTGGNSSLTDKRDNEARNAKRLAQICGVDTGHVWTESQARNTYENAIFSKNIIGQKHAVSARLLLVTSAFHARRSLATFKKADIAVTLYTTDFRGKYPRYTPDVLFMPSLTALARWEVLVHEWIGMAAYKLQGYA